MGTTICWIIINLCSIFNIVCGIIYLIEHHKENKGEDKRDA
jgi:hypothetical protein